MNMKRLILGLLGILAVVSQAHRACAAVEVGSQGTPPVRIHFGGFDQLSGGSDGTVLAELLKLPESAELRDQTLSKLAEFAAGNLQPRDAVNEDANPAEWIRSLLGSLWRNEWRFEMDGSTNAPAYTLAIRLTPDDRQLWNTNIQQLVSNWRLKQKTADYRLNTLTNGAWLAFLFAPVRSNDSARPNRTLWEQMQLNGKLPASSHWLSIDTKAVHLNWRFPGLASSIERLALQVAPRGENLRTEIQVNFATEQKWTLEPWNIPTNSITDPDDSLIRFTAVQGLAAWPAWRDFFKRLEVAKTPNQLFVWSQAYGPFAGQIEAATQVGDSTNFIQRVFNQLVPSVQSNLTENAVGVIKDMTNRIVWSGLPIVAPTLTPAPDSGFVLGRLLPLPLSTNRAPAELFGQLTERTNVLYYDWEITQARLAQIRGLLQLGSLLTTFSAVGAQTSAAKWLDAIGPKLGNTVTQAVADSKDQVTITRTSPIGFTSFELVGLAHWLESATFPRYEFDVRFRRLEPAVK